MRYERKKKRREKCIDWVLSRRALLFLRGIYQDTTVRIPNRPFHTFWAWKSVARHFWATQILPRLCERACRAGATDREKEEASSTGWYILKRRRCIDWSVAEIYTCKEKKMSERIGGTRVSARRQGGGNGKTCRRERERLEIRGLALAWMRTFSSSSSPQMSPLPASYNCWRWQNECPVGYEFKKERGTPRLEMMSSWSRLSGP